MAPKLASTYEFYAKRMREQYIEDGVLPTEIPTFTSLRARRVTDNIDSLVENQEVACVVEKREEFDDLDIVVNAKDIHRLKRQSHWRVRPFKLYHQDEEILVTIKEVVAHQFMASKLLKVKFQRFIEGRPNLITLPLKPVQEELSIHYRAGADFSWSRDSFQVWTYTKRFPPVIELDCSFLSPRRAIKIGDAEKLLPYGVYLHKKYHAQRFHAICKLTENNAYIKRKNMVLDHQEAIR